jgi:hypothetical protein
MPFLMPLGFEKMLVAFGKGEKTRWILTHKVVSAIGPEKTSGVLFFHAFSGHCVILSWQINVFLENMECV